MTDLEKILHQMNEQVEHIYREIKFCKVKFCKKVLKPCRIISIEKATKIVTDILESKPKGLEISKMLTVSTAHVKEETLEALSETLQNDIGLPVYVKGNPDNGSNFGVYIYLEPAGLSQISEDLKPLIDIAIENNCNVLCLDGDGPILKGFKTYESSMKEELERLYNENLTKGMTKDDAYTEAYSVICNKYDDADIDKELDGRNV